MKQKIILSLTLMIILSLYMSINVQANAFTYPSYEYVYINNWGLPLLEDSETIDFPFCGKDGFAEIDIKSIKNVISSETDIVYTSKESVVYVSTESGSILKVDNLSSIPPDEVELCNVGFPLTDIAVDENEVVYITSRNDLYTIDISTCTLTLVPKIHPDYKAVALSFDTAGNLYYGEVTSALVYRQDQEKLSDAYVWHDFGVGGSAGDFVMLNGKMYIAWRLSIGDIRLYEVEIDSDFNYVSHVDLGPLDGKTYGLASENGKLYSISDYNMYQISSLDPLIEDKVYWNSSGHGRWYGAAGLHEAQKLNIELFETAEDLKNQTNELPDTWKNTVKGGQTLHVRIEEEESGTVITKTIDITIYEKPNAGDDAIINVCNVTDNYDLFSELGVEAENGGTWEDPNGTLYGTGDMANFNGTSNDFGTYTYTVVTTHCEDTATIEFRNSNDFDAGLPPTTPINLCPKDLPINLFDALLGTPDSGGFWRDPNGVVFGSDDIGMLDPSVTGVLSGIYEYVLLSVVCGVETSTEVNIEVKSPLASIVEKEITVCKGAGTKKLFDEINGLVMPGGTWGAPDNTVFGTDYLGAFDPLLHAAGVYTYSEPDSCDEPIAKVTVSISLKSNSGTTSYLELCSADSSVSLFDELGGNPDTGGTWKDPNGVAFGTGHKVGLDPSVTGVLSGDYTYTVSTTDCPDPSSTVVNVIIDKAPNVGGDSDIKVCENQAEFNLFNKLLGTPDSNGLWENPSGVIFGKGSIAMFNPQTSEYGVYTYLITTPSCGTVSAIVNVEAATSANSGTTSNLELCSTDTAIKLFDELGGTPDSGGIWTDPNGISFGADDQGVLDPSLIGVLSGYYTYTVSTTECPTPSKTNVEVKINQAPNLGMDASITVCVKATVFNLFDKLGGIPDIGGVWKDPNGIVFGVDHLGSFDPSLTTNLYGVYSYSIDTNFCKESLTKVEVVLGDSANSGTSTSMVMCTTDMAINLFDELGGTPDSGGTWTDPNGIAFGANDQGVLDPSLIGVLSGNYTYTVSTPACPEPVKTIILVNIETTPEIILDDKVISEDVSTYDVTFLTNGAWNVSVSPNVGEIDELNAKITNVPYGIDIEIIVENPLNSECVNSLLVETPVFVCPTIDEPLNPSNEVICSGDVIPELSVDVKTTDGESANWYTEDGKLLKENSIPYTPSVDSIVAGKNTFLVETVNASGVCFSERIAVYLTVNEMPEVNLVAEGSLCIATDGNLAANSWVIIKSNLLSTEYTFTWEFNGQDMLNKTSSFITVYEPGEYELTYTDSNLKTCSNTVGITIEAYTAPERLDLKLSSGIFANDNDLIATVTGGTGNFEYSLDGGEYQTSNVFRNISLGSHEVTAVDIDGCGLPIKGAKYIMGFPEFFTPNGDKMHDTWNLELDPNEPMDVTIFVYDRFGKLIQQVFPNGPGWDGTFAGKNMPSDDYWFIATVKNTSESYTSHFTLVR